MTDAHAVALGSSLPLWSIAPFALMLLAIALVPLRQLRRTEHYLSGPGSPAAL